MKYSFKQILTFVLGWPLSFIALFFIFKTFFPKTQEISHLLSNINLQLLIIGILFFQGYYFTRSIIWKNILALYGHNFTFRDTAFHWASSEFKRYIPGNIWSFLGKSVLFMEKGVGKSDIARAMLTEMQIVFIGCLTASIIGLYFVFNQAFTFLTNIPYLYLLTVLTVILGNIIYIYQKFIIKKFIKYPKITFILEKLFPSFPENKILSLILSSTVAFIFFGLGYYFSISSVVNLPPNLILKLTGFFIFSLLIGLLSFITPTGLGVREGTMTLGLMSILNEKLAGFASIFGRISLVASEIIFLISAYLFSRISSVQSTTIENYVNRNSTKLVLLVFIIIFNLYFINISILRHENFYTGRFDLGNMDQTVWNTKNGRLFLFTDPDGTKIVSRLAYHADFILILLAPLYFIKEDPRLLLIIQSVIVSLGAVFVYLLTLEVLEKNGKWKMENGKFLALALSFSYLLNPGLQWSILYDFHAVTFATTFLLAAFYFLIKKKYLWFLLFALLSGITKEQVWVPVGLMGLYLVFSVYKFKLANFIKRRHEVYFGLMLFISSIIIFYYLVWHAIPNAAKASKHFALSYFNGEIKSPIDILSNFITDPDTNIFKVLSEDRLLYLKQLFEPTGYLPLLAFWYLIFPFTDIAISLLSDKPELHQIYYQYSAVVTPFLYIATIISIKNLKSLYPKLKYYFISTLIIFSVLTSDYLYGPLPWTRRPNIAMLIYPQKDREYIISKLQSIPQNIKLSSSNNIGAHLSQRKYIYTIPQGIKEADVIIFLLRNNSPAAEIKLAKSLTKNPEYNKLWEKGGFIAFKKNGINF